MRRYLPNIIIAFLLTPITLLAQLTMAFMAAEENAYPFFGLFIFLLAVFLLSLCIHFVFHLLSRFFNTKEAAPTPSFKAFSLAALITTGFWLLISSPFVVLPFI